MANSRDPNDDLTFTWSMKPDEKSEKESKKSFENLISLISDLAITGKVAGEALGKLWDGLQKSINESLQGFNEAEVGVSLNVKPEDLNALKYAITSIGGDSKQALPMLQQMDKVIQSFRNPATGPAELQKFFKDLSVYKVPKDVLKEIEDAIKSEDTIKALKLFADTRNNLGDQFSNFMNQRGLGALSTLEDPKQYADWQKAWAMSADRVFKINSEGLNKLQNGLAKFNAAFSGLDKWGAGKLGGLVDDLGSSMLTLTNRFLSWADAFKAPPGMKNLTDFLSKGWNINMKLLTGDISIGDMVKQNFLNFKDLVSKNLDTMKKQSEGMSSSEYINNYAPDYLKGKKNEESSGTVNNTFNFQGMSVEELDEVRKRAVEGTKDVDALLGWK